MADASADPHREPGRGAPVAEPSMEDILASIRRILNDDAPADAAPESEPADDVLVLDDTMLARPANDHLPAPLPPPTPPALPSPAPPSMQTDLAEEAVTMADIAHHDTDETASLLAPHAKSAAEAALANLMQRLDGDRAPQVYRGGPTIEDLVREEIRPILKSWLDEQLPAMVERLVRAEIERLTARR
jgi:cell pole-organizing protein PopZ